MGKRGTKPTTAQMKLEKGTFRADQHKGELDTPPIELYPHPPETLKGHAQAVWEKLLPKLMGYRVVSDSDLFQFENMCYVYGEWRKCCEIVESEGNTFMSDKGNILPNPMVHIGSAHFKAYNQIAAKFGLTPSDRVGLPNTIKEDVDPLESLAKKASGG